MKSALAVGKLHFSTAFPTQIRKQGAHKPKLLKVCQCDKVKTGKPSARRHLSIAWTATHSSQPATTTSPSLAETVGSPPSGTQTSRFMYLDIPTIPRTSKTHIYGPYTHQGAFVNPTSRSLPSNSFLQPDMQPFVRTAPHGPVALQTQDLIWHCWRLDQ